MWYHVLVIKKGKQVSTNVNTDILERANEMVEECTNSMLGDQLQNALDERPQDLDRIQNLTLACERHLQFTDTIREGDIY